MLTALAIRDVVLIEALDLDFQAGLGVLTGETGAGKSILLDALGLALGVRADSGLVRVGAPQARVTASFLPPGPDTELGTLLAENDIAPDPGEPLVIRRTVLADGGSRAFVNDHPCSAALLRDIGRHLVEIHGQHDDRGLLNPRGHRALLDSFGRCDRATVASAHSRWIAARDALVIAQDMQAKAEAEREWLEHSVAELRLLRPEAGEEALLADDRARMQRGEKLTGDLEAVRQVFEGSEGGMAQLRSAARRLDRIATEHPLLADALAAIDRALAEASDAEERLSAAVEALSFDPVRLDTIETRLFELRAIARKHHVTPDALAALATTLATQLAMLDAGSGAITALTDAEAAAAAAYRDAATALTAARQETAGRLDVVVAGELGPLKLDSARFRTLIEPLRDEQCGPHGRDRVEFLIATNSGADFAPLLKIASGGELSRFILALKVALAEDGGARTIVFDEIDRGVGGAVASAIGDRLARLAENLQLLAVTHSPQVAARGRHHYFIAKSFDHKVTRTDVTELDGDGRREEIARMLSGAEVTAEARAQATRLLETEICDNK